jgi:hypothetical protein
MNKTLVIGVILLCVVPAVFAQEMMIENPQQAKEAAPMYHNIGLAAGFITGNGLSYRQWFPNSWGFQTTFFPYYLREHGHKEMDVSLGITGLKIFSRSTFANLYGYGGPHLEYNYNNYYNWDNSPYYYYQSPTETTTLSGGGGVGIDFHFWKLSFNFMFGVMGKTDFKENDEVSFSTEVAGFYTF